MSDHTSGVTPPSRQPAAAPSSQDSTSTTFEPIRKWLGPGATNQDVAKFLNQLFMDLINQVKKESAQSKQAAQHLKDVIEGNDS
jgi:hypothetical protein